MIRINVNASDVKEYDHSIVCKMDVGIHMEGNGRILIEELIAAFESFEEREPELWTAALDEWLKRKGV